jgi:hypothetical protein
MRAVEGYRAQSNNGSKQPTSGATKGSAIAEDTPWAGLYVGASFEMLLFQKVAPRSY